MMLCVSGLDASLLARVIPEQVGFGVVRMPVSAAGVIDGPSVVPWAVLASYMSTDVSV